VLIDGVPQSTNRNVFRNLQNIDPAAIERIEVLRGPTAIYGSEATGGIINIITRTPEEEKFTATTEGSLDFSLTHPEDSLGGNIQQLISGQEGDFDYTISASFDHRRAFFDAEGDRIPPDPNSQGESQTPMPITYWGSWESISMKNNAFNSLSIVSTSSKILS
jgi:iron complex outermembrane receptor protein